MLWGTRVCIYPSIVCWYPGIYLPAYTLGVPWYIPEYTLGVPRYLPKYDTKESGVVPGHPKRIYSTPEHPFDFLIGKRVHLAGVGRHPQKYAKPARVAGIGGLHASIVQHKHACTARAQRYDDACLQCCTLFPDG